MTHERVERECARLIKPTRNNVPTEYNVQYKRWHKAGNNRHTEANPADNPVKRGKLVKPGRLHSANDPTRSHKPFHSRPWTTEMEKEKIYKRSTAYIDQYIADKQAGGHKGVPLQQVSRPSTPVTKQAEPDPEFKENYYKQCGKHNKNAQRPPVTPTTAWVGTEDLEKTNNLKSFPHKYNTNGNEATTLNDEPIVNTSSLLRYNSSVMSKSPGSAIENAWKKKRPSSHHSYMRCEGEMGRQSPVPKVKSSVTAFQKSRETRGASTEERNLKKIYAHATDSEIKRLLAEIKSRPTSKEIIAKKQHSKNISTNASEMSISKYDLDKIREAAYRGCIQVPPFCRKDVWSTTYGKSFGRDWKPENYTIPYNTDFDRTKELQHEAAVHCDVEVKDHYISSDFAKSNDVACKTSVVSMAENQSRDSDNESSCGSSIERSRTPSTDPNQCQSVTELTETMVNASESDKRLAEGNAIEEKEFDDLFKEDGRPKMTGDTTTGLAHDGAQPPRYEDPIWADHTVKSLGSGHWNLLWKHYYNWETSGKFDKNKKLSEMIPRKIENDKYQIVIYDQGDPGPTAKNPLTKDMVFGKYGGGGIPRKNHISYVTEYMRKFTEIPMQRNRRGV